MSAVTTSALEQAMTELTPLIGRRAACAAVGLPRATSYRRHPVRAARPPVVPAQRATPRQPRALTDVERAAVLAELHAERFTDASPATVYATLLDEGRYLASISTM